MQESIPNKCLRCDKSFGWQEVITGKMPENVWFCFDCIGKFEDNNNYTGDNAWVVTEYEPGLTVSNE